MGVGCHGEGVGRIGEGLGPLECSGLACGCLVAWRGSVGLLCRAGAVWSGAWLRVCYQSARMASGTLTALERMRARHSGWLAVMASRLRGIQTLLRLRLLQLRQALVRLYSSDKPFCVEGMMCSATKVARLSASSVLACPSSSRPLSRRVQYHL